MIDKSLESITYEVIEEFVAQKYHEGKTLDYKLQNYGNDDQQKKELLKDVSSFANTLGGDILIGIAEEKGVPIDVPGVVVWDIDKEKLRLEAIIREGLEPRIDFSIHHVSSPAGTVVIILRIKQSNLFPHRVIFHGKPGEFWGRNSAGKYSMDTNELRTAFTLSESIYEQIKAFRRDRVNGMKRGEFPMNMVRGSKFILHLIPVASFRSRTLFDIPTLQSANGFLRPISAHAWDFRLNLDGQMAFAIDNGLCFSYSQLFRNGVIELVLSEIVSQSSEHGRVLHTRIYEKELLGSKQAFANILKLLSHLGVNPPIWCFLTITDVRDACIPRHSSIREVHRIIDRHDLLLPEQIINDMNSEPTAILKPLFDLVWNAAGFEHSLNFDLKGSFIDS
jgi:hypothetical protein